MTPAASPWPFLNSTSTAHNVDAVPSLSFIDVGEPSAQRKRQNANQARSLVMTERRRKQRIAKKKAEVISSSTSKTLPINPDDELESLCVQPQSRSPRFLLKPMDPEFAEAVWDACLRKSLQIESISDSQLIEQDIVALHGYDKPVTMHLHKLINHVVHTMWPKYWPAKSSNEASPLAVTWWPLFLNVPAVFHAFLYAAAVHHDDLRGQSDISRSREILTHKSEALQQLQLALTNSESLSTIDDSLVLAMAYLGMESEEYDRDQPVIEPSPFIVPSILRSIQWTRHYAYAKENVHIKAATRLVDMKGGLDALTPPLAKSIFINDLQIAAKYVRKPKYAFWDVPDLIQGAQDPLVNVIPENEQSILRPLPGFQALESLGLSPDAQNLLERAKTITLKIELYTKGELLSPDFYTLLFEKNHVHHDLLSLPTAATLGLIDQERDIYECCRIGGLIYSTGVLFPLLPSSGTPRRLVDMTKQIVQEVKLETCMQGGAKVLLWVLVLAGIMAQNTLERPWFLRRMKPLLAMEGVQSWGSLKTILKMFLWMDIACDEGARCLYEDLSRPPYL